MQGVATSKSRILIVLIGVVLALLILCGTFGLGVFVGAQKAKFSYRWAENYHRNFGGPSKGFMGLPRERLVDGHGTFGRILKVEGNKITVEDRRGIEKTVLVTKSTNIKLGTETIKAKDLKEDDYIVVVGRPNQKGQIEAKMIRAFRFSEE